MNFLFFDKKRNKKISADTFRPPTKSRKLKGMKLDPAKKAGSHTDIPFYAFFAKWVPACKVNALRLRMKASTSK